MTAGLDDPFEQQITALLDAMKAARIAAADKNATDLAIAKKVLVAAQDVEQVIASWKAAEAPAEAAEADFS